MNCERFEFREGLLKRYLNKRKEKLFKSVTALSLPVFMRNVDVISYAPSTSGYYEARIVKIIQFFAQDNQLNDFFIDIGANIGLISCQVVSCFKECHCFEPNPDCFKILSVNLNITSNHSSEIQLYNFGLGEREFGTELVVPKSNWGGGSIVDGNGYTDALLTQNSHHDFLYYQIKIQKTSKVLGNLFLSLKKKGLKRGVIKINV